MNEDKTNNQENSNQEEQELQQNESGQNELINKISLLEENNKNLNDSLLRLAAELDNTRKRNREEIDKANKYAISNFAGDLVLVVENFYLAANNLPEEEINKSPLIKHFVEAMMMTQKELTKTLERYGIKRIYPLNEKFDHNFHEAISQIPANEGEEEGTIKQVVQAGYSINERLIRPALVIVLNKTN
jgi:molecular chaperone GrpE